MIIFALAAGGLARNRIFFADDAYITLRYAAHIVAGHGPVWNIGDAPLEGFTSPLHLLLISLLGAAGLKLEWAARAVNFAAHLGIELLVWHELRRSTGMLGALLGILLTAASFPMLMWDLGGLDACCFALPVLAAVMAARAYLEQPGTGTLLLCGLLLGVALITRPEGLPVAVGCLGAVLLLGTPARLRDVAAASLVFAAIAGALLAWRWIQFGAVLPNTYYAKVYGVPLGLRMPAGAGYLVMASLAPPCMPVFAAAAGAAVLLRRLAAREQLLFWIVIAAYLASMVTAGGDFMLAARFLVPALPLFAIVLVRSLAALDILARAPRVVVTVAVLLSAAQLASPWLNAGVSDTTPVVGQVVGRYIARAWPAGSLVALNAAGATPYFADNLRFIDMLGLNDATIARTTDLRPDLGIPRRMGHLKANGAYVLSRKPDFIILGSAIGTTVTEQKWAFWLADAEIAAAPGFAAAYRACRLDVPVPGDLVPAMQSFALPFATSVPLVFYARAGVAAPGCP